MEIHNKIAIAGLALALGGGFGVANAQTQDTSTTTRTTSPKSSSPSNADATFAKKAAEGGNAEVKMGRLAQDKGDSQAVKDFGKRMEDDHGLAGQKLQDLAREENMTLPTGLSTSDQQVYDRLSKLSGQAFDVAYMRDMVKDHTTDIAEFQQEAKNGTDSKLKSFASDTLPTLQDHLKQAQQIRAAQGGKNVKSSQAQQ
jgi:putative membrane protein